METFIAFHFSLNIREFTRKKKIHKCNKREQASLWVESPSYRTSDNSYWKEPCAGTGGVHGRALGVSWKLGRYT